MIGFEEAVEIIRSSAAPLGIETIPVAQAAGRVLAQPVVAMIDSPRSDVSSMDGYAVREADLAEPPTSLRIVGASYAGSGSRCSVTPGTCARIFTGAPVPDGADRVVIQENVRRDGEVATFERRLDASRYIRRRGSDFPAGDVLLSPGRLLDARALVAVAGADLATLEVYRRPRLRILCTGDELAEPGSARMSTDAIPDSISLGIAALAREWGAECLGSVRLRDDLVLMEAAARAAIADADLIVVTGGASVGEKDFAKAMFAPFELQLLFSKVSIKPGKPAWFGRAGGRLVIGLPGNPTSAMVTARLFLAPLLASMTGRSVEDVLAWRTMTLVGELAPCGERETFHRAREKGGAAEILAFQDSGAQRALADADLLVRQRADSPAISPGDRVEVLDF